MVDIAKEINPAFKKAHKAIQKRLDTDKLYFRPLEVFIPHGRGAGATTFCAMEVINAIEHCVKAAEIEKPAKPVNFPYHTAKPNRKDYPRNVVVVCKEPGLVKNTIPSYLWAIEKLGLKDKYNFSAQKRLIERKGSTAKIFFFDYQALNRQSRGGLSLIPPKSSIYVIDEAQEFREHEYHEVEDMLGQSATYDNNRILLVSYNLPHADHWLEEEAKFCASGDTVNTVVAKGTFKTVPQEWLGASFFRSAEALRKSNPALFKVEFLGDTTKPKRKVPRGTTKTLAQQKTKTKNKKKVNLNYGQQRVG